MVIVGRILENTILKKLKTSVFSNFLPKGVMIVTWATDNLAVIFVGMLLLTVLAGYFIGGFMAKRSIRSTKKKIEEENKKYAWRGEGR